MKKKFQATKTDLSIIRCVFVVLLVLVILFSSTVPGFKYLSMGVTTALGIVGYWGFLPFFALLAIYLILRKKNSNIKLTKVFIGAALILFGLLILLTAIFNDQFDVDEATNLFKQINNPTEKGFINYKLGGGYIGFVLTGLINSFATKVGTIIISSVIVFGGLLIIFLKSIIKGVKAIASKAKAKKTEKKEEVKEPAIENVETRSETFEIRPNFEETRPIMDNQLKNSSLKKAVFVMNKPNEIKKAEVEPETVSDNVIIEQIQEENVNEELAKPELVVETEPTPIRETVTPNVDPNHPTQPKAAFIKDYVYPSIDLLKSYEENNDTAANEETCEVRSQIINQTFANFKVGAQVVGHTVGPSVTRFDIQTNPDVSVNSLTKYIDDISVRLGGLSVRFEPIVFGKATSGLEIPNKYRTNVGLREAIESIPNDKKHARYVPFGKNISGDYISADVAEFPHLLVSGSTGSGKTIFVHAMILSLLMKNRPEELKLILIDPKKVEFSFYEDIPHLLCPIITDVKQSYLTLKKLADEMERRYTLMHDARVREADEFNEYANENGLQPLPHICVFVDEYADLIELCKDIREPVSRICQKARAAGIHLMLATQRPSVNIIDGVIKSNIATRVALYSASVQDSITIIGHGGAETLLKHGDMLIDSPLLSSTGNPRVQGCYVGRNEINAVCDFLRKKYGPQYSPEFMNLEEKVEVAAEGPVSELDRNASEDAQYETIKGDIIHREYCSISYIQRTYGMGFGRAGKIFHMLKKDGIVSDDGGDARGSKVLCYVPPEQQMGSVDTSSFVPDEKPDNGN